MFQPKKKSNNHNYQKTNSRKRKGIIIANFSLYQSAVFNGCMEFDIDDDREVNRFGSAVSTDIASNKRLNDGSLIAHVSMCVRRRF